MSNLVSDHLILPHMRIKVGTKGGTAQGTASSPALTLFLTCLPPFSGLTA